MHSTYMEENSAFMEDYSTFMTKIRQKSLKYLFLETHCTMIVISIEPQSGGFISLNKSVRDVADH